MYFMVSGTVMRASSQMWKKLSTVVARSENYGRVRQYFDPLCAELFQRNAYYADKWFIGDLYFVFLG